MHIIVRFVSTMFCRMAKFSKKKDSQAPKKGSGKEKGDKEDKTQSPSHSPVPPLKEQTEVVEKLELKPPPEEQKAESEQKIARNVIPTLELG